MKHIILLALIATSALAAQDQTTAKTTNTAKKKTATKAAAKPAPSIAQPLTIPTDAVPNPDGTYAYTDKSGKKWTYSRTPFGVSKIETVAAGPTAAVPAEQQTRTTDNGATVKFAKPTPFGTSTWEKKKSELTDEERALFQSQHPDNHQ